MAVSLIATKPQRYGKTWLKVGDAFTATRDDAKVLKALGRAKDPVPAPTPPPPPLAPTRTSKYRTAAMSAPIAPEPTPEPAPEPVSEPTPASFDVPMMAEPTHESEASTDDSDESATPKKRTYKRRDLTAEE